jgi:hypothetical protein
MHIITIAESIQAPQTLGSTCPKINSTMTEEYLSLHVINQLSAF